MLCDHNILESDYRVIMACPVYNESHRELFNYSTELENNFNTLNDDEKIVHLFSATDVSFILSRPALIFLLSEEVCCIILDRKY